jgi:hypothetical protein
MLDYSYQETNEEDNMIHGNVNDSHKGRKVIARTTSVRGYDDSFPGWGDPNAADYLKPITAGTVGTVTRVESHGSNPWTRYTVRFNDGVRASGLVPGADFDWK